MSNTNTETKRLPYAARVLHEIEPDLDPIGMECHMRVQYGTLDHLPHSTFVEEAKLARQCELQQPGYLAMVRKSYGM